jgi:hypothetical protein
VLFEIYYAEVAPVVSSRDVAASVAALAKLATVLNPARRMDVAYFQFQESTVRMLEGRAEEAVRAAQEALAIGREAGLPAMQIPHFLVREALSHLKLGALDAALARLRRGDRRRHRRRRRQLPHAAADSCSHIARAVEGRIDEAVARLRELLPVCRERRYLGYLRQLPEVAGHSSRLALANGMEPEYVKMVIPRAPACAAVAMDGRLAVAARVAHARRLSSCGATARHSRRRARRRGVRSTC